MINALPPSPLPIIKLYQTDKVVESDTIDNLPLADQALHYAQAKEAIEFKLEVLNFQMQNPHLPKEIVERILSKDKSYVTFSNVEDGIAWLTDA